MYVKNSRGILSGGGGGGICLFPRKNSSQHLLIAVKPLTKLRGKPRGKTAIERYQRANPFSKDQA